MSTRPRRNHVNAIQEVQHALGYTTRRRRLSSITRAPLPKGDGGARPAFDRGSVSNERDLIIFDAGDMLHDAYDPLIAHQEICDSPNVARGGI